jgi:hypothetical protein
MAKRRENRQRLDLWQKRLSISTAAYAAELDRMVHRDAIYRGTHDLTPFTEKTKYFRAGEAAYHVHNIAAENIESMIDSNVPQPKVTAVRPSDEWRAKIVEDMLRNMLVRLPSEQTNDIMERIVPIQGGGYYYEEWDNDAGKHGVDGYISITPLHPKMIVPQAGVTTGVEDMDYFIIKSPQTKASVRRIYGVDVDDESESEPDVRSAEGEAEAAEDMVTLYMGYERTDRGINRFLWVNDTVIEDVEDYRARRRRRCTKCGAPEPYYIAPIEPQPPAEMTHDEQTAQTMLLLGQTLGIEEAMQPELNREKPEKGKPTCAQCGNDTFEDAPTEYEEIFQEIRTRTGLVIPGARPGLSRDGKPVLVPTRIPAYKPTHYPLILQRNVSLYGQLLGDSDIDKIADQQNALNWTLRKIDERLMDAGTIITLPSNTRAATDPQDGRILRLTNVSDLSMIRTFEFTGDLSSLYAQYGQIYESARNILGITDSYQGRADTTATSGKAKEFAAAQSAGRLESKRKMKNAAYAELFEAIFQEFLANADEPRTITLTNSQGDVEYETFSRWDFLEWDEVTGEYYWVDDFLFDVDSAAPLASNREAMWQETRSHLESGALGDPTLYETLIEYWAMMEKLHYPLAGMIRESLNTRMEQQQAAMAQQEALMAQQAMLAAQTPSGTPGAGNIPGDVSGNTGTGIAGM